jgi:hypothetical protein
MTTKFWNVTPCSLVIVTDVLEELVKLTVSVAVEEE